MDAVASTFPWVEFPHRVIVSDAPNKMVTNKIKLLLEKGDALTLRSMATLFSKKLNWDSNRSKKFRFKLPRSIF